MCDLLAFYVSRWDLAYGVGVVNRTLMPSLVSCLPPGLVHNVEPLSTDVKSQRLRMYCSGYILGVVQQLLQVCCAFAWQPDVM